MVNTHILFRHTHTHTLFRRVCVYTCILWTCTHLDVDIHTKSAHLPTYESVDSGGIDRLSFPIMTLGSIGHEVYMLGYWEQNLLMLLLIVV